MATVYISLGSNVGSRLANCLTALERMEGFGIKVEKGSPWFLSEPLGIPQPWFINAVARTYTLMSPHTLLHRLQEIERKMGRKTKGTGGPRIIDLDIILYDRIVLTTPWLTLPHPRFRERRFVLEPLVTLAPRLKDPLTGLTAQELLEKCQDPSRVIPLKTGGKDLEIGGLDRPAHPERLPRAFWRRL